MKMRKCNIEKLAALQNRQNNDLYNIKYYLTLNKVPFIIDDGVDK